MQKKCSKCELELEFSAFNKRKTCKDGYQPFCRDCQHKIQQAHYKANVDYYVEKSQKHLAKRRDELSPLKDKCVKCGETDEVCLDFHHVDATTKSFDIATGIRTKSRADVMKEIQKCVVLCANCHRKLHAGRF